MNCKKLELEKLSCLANIYFVNYAVYDLIVCSDTVYLRYFPWFNISSHNYLLGIQFAFILQ